MKPPLLLFGLHKISKNADWSVLPDVELPVGCGAVVASGGLPDTWERRHGKSSAPDETGLIYPLNPFLASADWVISRIAWALLGTAGRLYPIYRSSTYALKLNRFDPTVLPDSRSDVLASPKLPSLQDAKRVNWGRGLLTCFSGGLALGFWGETTKLERKLKGAQSFVPFRHVAESKLEGVDQKLEDVHPYLYANWRENGFDWILENAPLVVRPWGWEGEDAIFLSTRMPHSEMLQVIHRELGGEFEILEYDGDDTYQKWRSWRLGQSHEDDPWSNES